MKSKGEIPIRGSDLRGVARLAVTGVLAVTNVVEQLHGTIVRAAWITDARPQRSTLGITGLVYRSIREITGLVGDTLDAALGGLQPLLDAVAAPREGATRDALVAALNGVIGDHLAATGNPLAMPMALRRHGRTLPPDAPGGRVLLLIHGLCMSDQQWCRRNHDHGAALARALGYRPVYLRYNSGLHISENGRRLARHLERWFHAASEPVTELVVVGYSMGGLLIRSACHYAEQAGYAWPRVLSQIVFLGTPHHGAPMERGGNWLQLTASRSPYGAPLAGLGRLRSAGITDLRHGNLLDEDWRAIDRFATHTALPTLVPLRRGVRYAALAGTTGQRDGDLGDRLLGDGLVPVASALGQHRDPGRCVPIEAHRQWIGYGINHLDLLDHRDVYAALRRFIAEIPPERLDDATGHPTS